MRRGRSSTPALIDRVIAAIGERQAALPLLPVAETLKRADADEMVSETVSRDGLYFAQTPQGFPFWPINAAHEKAYHAGKTGFTDDAAIAEWTKMPVQDRRRLAGQREAHLGKGYRHGRPAAVAAARFPDVRTGNGYDVHAFEPGDHVMLCGVAIPHGKKLSGHSDADVALHALTDALLATCGAGDIGTHFPPSDPQWRGAASRIFVEHAARLVREQRRTHRQCRHHADRRGAAHRAAPRGDGRGAGADAGDCAGPRLGQGDDQREAGLRRARGRHRGDRDRERRLSREACRNERSDSPFEALARRRARRLPGARRSCSPRPNPAPAA